MKATLDVGLLTAHSEQKAILGNEFTRSTSEGDKDYIYVQRAATDAGTPVAGDLMYDDQSDESGCVVKLATSGYCLPSLVKGVVVDDIPAAGEYVCLQTGGYNGAVVTDAGDDFVAGGRAIAINSLQGVSFLASSSALLHKVIGEVLGAGSTTYDTVPLNLVLNKG